VIMCCCCIFRCCKVCSQSLLYFWYCCNMSVCVEWLSSHALFVSLMLRAFLVLAGWVCNRVVSCPLLA
jgi:hypothetical protein